MTTPRLYIRLFGGLRVYGPDGGVVDLPPGQTGTLLALLALQPGHHLGREEVAEILWPEEDLESVRHRLRNCLYQLKRQIPLPEGERDEVITTRAGVLRLRAEAVTTDVGDSSRPCLRPARLPARLSASGC